MTDDSLDTMRNLLPVGNDLKTLETMLEVLSVLSKNDAFKIFTYAKDGLKSELDTPTKIGLTRKQYYTRLNQLVSLKLIAKDDDFYSHTSFGSMIYQNYVMPLLDRIKNIKEYEMVDALKKHPEFKPEEISGFLSKISENTRSSIFVDKTVPKIRSSITYTFNEMVTKVLEIIEYSQNEILLMSRFRNDHIINKLLQKANRGVKVRVLADINTVDTFFENESGVLTEDENKNERITVVANPFYPSKVDRRYVETPFCLLLVDGTHVGMEIVDNYQPKKFLMTTFSIDPELANDLKKIFDELWKKSKDTLPKSMVTRTKNNHK